MVVLWLGKWNGWNVLYQDGRIWLVNPITGHRRAANGGGAR